MSTPQSKPDITPVIDQTLNKIDFALQKVYTSQSTLGQQLDQLEAILAEFNSIESPSVQAYIEKILKTKEIIESTQQRVTKLQSRADLAKVTLREKHNALAPPVQSNSE